jgi:SAM-dependent methyltransferase
VQCDKKACYLCGGNKIIQRKGNVRDNDNLQVLECLTCGLVFLSSFSHINDSFYEQSGMHETVTQVESWQNETEWDDERRFQFVRRLIENKRVLDFGCGNGNFLLKVKKMAAYVEGVELEQRLASYFKKKELCVYNNISQTSGNFDFITMFHVLEHLPNPVEFLQAISSKLDNKGQLIVEVPNANDALLSLYDCDAFSRFTYWSCHLFLFTEHTLSEIGKSAGLRLNYIKQVQRYSLANHLYWLANGLPGGHKEWGFIDSQEVQDGYEKQLASIGRCDTIMASFSRN